MKGNRSGAAMEDPEEITAAVRSFAERARRAEKSHFLPEDLLAYHEGQLSADHSETIRDHLAVCAQCADLVLDLASFPEIELAAPAERLSNTELAQRWESFRQRLKQEHPLERQSRARAVFYWLHPRPGALAAGLLVACLGLALWVVMLRQRLAEDSRPSVRVAVSSLVPQETAAARNQESPELTAVPAWADRILLILNLFEPRSYAAYQVEFFDAREGGKRVWSSRDLRRAPDGNFALEVPRGFLPAGAYRIELSGLAGSRQYPLAVYNLLLDLK